MITQGAAPKEAAVRAGVADEAVGAAVKKSGLLDTLVELGRKA